MPFTDSTTTYTKALELAAIGLWGPAPICTDYEFKHYISFIDAYSRYVWIYFLMSKSEAYNVVIQFINIVERQTDSQVKILQTDGGTEFYHMKTYLQRKGIA